MPSLLAKPPRSVSFPATGSCSPEIAHRLTSDVEGAARNGHFGHDTRAQSRVAPASVSYDPSLTARWSGRPGTRCTARWRRATSDPTTTGAVLPCLQERRYGVIVRTSAAARAWRRGRAEAPTPVRRRRLDGKLGLGGQHRFPGLLRPSNAEPGRFFWVSPKSSRRR